MKMKGQHSLALNRGTRVGLVIGVSVAISSTLFFIPRVPLGAEYHVFADQRTFFGLANCLDVLSNIPFVLIGTWGLISLVRTVPRVSFVEARERIPYLVFFAGVALTGIGSGWYHLAPGDSRLIWDLLPMTFCFTSLLSAVIMERICLKAGIWLLLPLNVLGAASVLYLSLTLSEGHGDLRPYLFIQFFPAMLIALMICLFPPRYTRTADLMLAFLFFGLAKCFEVLDKQIYSLGSMTSGHTLKHLTAALACFWILRMIKLRYPSTHVSEGEAGRRGWPVPVAHAD
jgi:hypothetical protein